MRLSELLNYEDIVIQCHDNPDADAVASGFGLYCYFKEHGKTPRLVYGGHFQICKSNLVFMIENLNIPIEYVTELSGRDGDLPELLITVDCQYGERNVTGFIAQNIAVIDHHQISSTLPALSEVRSNLGACSTLIRELLKNENYDINNNKLLSTALYYGLMTDTNQFVEITHPLDKDLRDEAIYDRSLITLFRNSNLSLQELEIAGEALSNYKYNDRYRYATVEARPCDPNILGIISDMMLEVDSVDTCVVYSILTSGIKLSIRSCRKEVKASELAEYITEDIGGGGGHLEKAGGFIQIELLQKKITINDLSNDIYDYFINVLNEYFSASEIIYAKDYDVDLTDFMQYQKAAVSIGYVKANEVFPNKTDILIRTLEGDIDTTITDDLYIMIGIKGEVYPNRKNVFEKNNQTVDEPYCFNGEYEPMIKSTIDGTNVSLIPYARSCIAKGGVRVYAKQLKNRIKVFTSWDEQKYMLGRPGDYLAVRADNLHDIYVIEQEIFKITYKKWEEAKS